MRVAALVGREDGWYVARCHDFDIEVASQGETADEAVENLRKTLGLMALPAAVEPREPPVLVHLDVPARVPSPRGGPVVECARLVRRLEELGWVAEAADHHIVLRRGERRVVVPGFREIAPGVYRVIAKTLGEDVLAEPAPRATESLARLDALFSAHPHGDDTTRLVREQRDAG